MAMFVSSDKNFVLTPEDFELIALALKEDLHYPYIDATSDFIFDSSTQGQAHILTKHPDNIVICGLVLIKELLQRHFPLCRLESLHHDGEVVQPCETVALLSGPAKALLMAERTILNFLQHLSAISTLTAKYVAKISHTSMKILDTRKTTPGFRHLDKYAVRCGGGVNHRMGLFDAMMIKDTHIDVLGDINAVLTRLKTIPKKLPIIIEVRDQFELDAVLTNALSPQKLGLIDRVLLDNMNVDELQKSAEKCKNIIETEASGNISLENIAEIAETGVNYASVGKLTHSAGIVDLSMRCITLK